MPITELAAGDRLEDKYRPLGIGAVVAAGQFIAYGAANPQPANPNRKSWEPACESEELGKKA